MVSLIGPLILTFMGASLQALHIKVLCVNDVLSPITYFAGLALPQPQQE